MIEHINYSYAKAMKVIETSITPAHLKSARRYINNFFRVYSQGGFSDYNKRVVIKADKAAADMYSQLLNFIIIKEKNLK